MCIRDRPIENLKNFRQLNYNTAGHPEFGHADGIETTTGPLGQGLATAVGMALSEKLMASRFGNNLVNHFTYVIAGDGCLQEGISHEAIEFSGHLKLSKLIVFGTIIKFQLMDLLTYLIRQTKTIDLRQQGGIPKL